MQTIQESGGHVFYDSSFGSPEEPAWLLDILGHDFFYDVLSVSWNDPFAPLGDGPGPVPDLQGLTFRKLQDLDLRNTQVTDTELVRLEELASLQSLDLARTDTSDVGLEHLKDLTTLRFLYLDDTQVTPEGVKKLQEALPDCEIVY